MFRNFYAEQNMTDPRDSWYKPNLLYNIHYRPPNPPTPPKMVVLTKEFNPSICTCGEHGCEPRYRMEREVVWLNKEVKSREDTEVREMIQEKRHATTKLDYKGRSRDDGDSDDGDNAEENDGEWESGATSEENQDGMELYKEAEYKEMSRDRIHLRDMVQWELLISSSEKSESEDTSNVLGTSNGEELVEKKNVFTEGSDQDSLPGSAEFARPDSPDIDVPDEINYLVNLA